jgi:hypothetical protein
MTTALAALGLLWLVCAILAYGLSLALSARYYRERANGTSFVGAALAIAALGPFGLYRALATFAGRGTFPRFRWRQQAVDAARQQLAAETALRDLMVGAVKQALAQPDASVRVPRPEPTPEKVH